VRTGSVAVGYVFPLRASVVVFYARFEYTLPAQYALSGRNNIAIVAGVDFGTLSGRVTLFDSARGRLGQAACEYPLHLRPHEPEFATQSHRGHMRYARAGRRCKVRAALSELSQVVFCAWNAERCGCASRECFAEVISHRAGSVTKLGDRVSLRYVRTGACLPEL